MKKNAGSRIPNFTKQESERIKGSFDFVGVNHYDTISIKNNPSSLEMETRDMYADMAATLIGVCIGFMGLGSNTKDPNCKKCKKDL
ncbi:putative hydroxyisourate hydrolase [Helianthus annuus]|nr:putative hydroxyisourate hydrolase [Helianthus annuus]